RTMKEGWAHTSEALPAAGQTRRAGRAPREPMVVADARDNVHAVGLAAQLVIQLRDLVGSVVGLGAAGREEGDLQVAGRNFGELRRELDGRRRAEAPIRRTERELLHL